MTNFTAIMKLDPLDNRVAKYMAFKTRAEADAHVAAHIGNYPDAFVNEDEYAGYETDPATWVIDPATNAITERSRRPKPMRDWTRVMEATDTNLPRWFEDAVTEGSVILKPGRVKDNYDAKVALRGNKP